MKGFCSLSGSRRDERTGRDDRPRRLTREASWSHRTAAVNSQRLKTRVAKPMIPLPAWGTGGDPRA